MKDGHVYLYIRFSLKISNFTVDFVTSTGFSRRTYNITYVKGKNQLSGCTFVTVNLAQL
jgi:hypothetical protein